MAVPTTYAELQTEVAAWLNRTGDTSVTNYIPTAIGMAEAFMSAKIKSRSMETRSNLSCIASNAYVTLPTDVVEVRRLLLSSTTPTRALIFRTPDELSREFSFSETGEPRAYTVIGGSIQLAPIPDSTYTLELTYLQKIPALSNSNTTNWLLTAYPNVYIHGALGHMQPFIMEDARMPMFAQMFKDGIEAINAIDWYSGSTMSVRNG